MGSATDEIDFLDEEVRALTDELARTVARAKKANAPPDKTTITQLDKKLSHAKQNLEAMRVEMRDIPDPSKPKYHAKAEAHADDIRALANALARLREEAAATGTPGRKADDMSAIELIDEGKRVQVQSLSSVARMKEQLAETHKVGTATATKLKAQTEQLKKVEEDVHQVRANLVRSDALVKAFVRRIMTDKIVKVFVCLIFLAVVAIIVIKVVQPGLIEEANIPTEVLDPTGSSAAATPDGRI